MDVKTVSGGIYSGRISESYKRLCLLIETVTARAAGISSRFDAAIGVNGWKAT